MPKHHKVSHPVKLHAPKGSGALWNGTPVKGGGSSAKQTNTANGSRTPVRPGMGATRSEEWYRKND